MTTGRRIKREYGRRTSAPKVPGSKWNLAGDLPPTTIRRRANAKELRRAYDRAREELRTLEREARPKDIK